MKAWFKNPTNLVGAFSWLAQVVAIGGAAYMQTNPKLAPYVPVLMAVSQQLPPVVGPGVTH